jgi:hypothetical protein
MISVELFEMILRAEVGGREGYRVETNAPKDLKVLGFAPVDGEPILRTVFAFVESESFAEVAEGSQPPLIEPFQYTMTKEDD